MNGKGDMSIELILNDEVDWVKKTRRISRHVSFWLECLKFKGEMVQIRIIDEDDRPFVYFDVDHIVQNNIPLEGIAVERIVKMSLSTINIPIENAPRGILRFTLIVS